MESSGRTRRDVLRGAAVGLTALAAGELARPSVAGAEGLIGRFRGVVIDNDDPLRLGRVRALVPDALGETPSGWALPSAPYAGLGVGFFAVPPLGAQVWIEFEQGDIDRPVLVGGLWGPGEPPPPASPDVKVLKTQSSAITLNDSADGGVTIDSTSIRINGKASFSRSGVVTIPAGATSATVGEIELTANSLILAMLQENVPGVFVRAAVPDPVSKTITVFLNRSAGRGGARVAWFVAG